jgi:hypothetical protein
LSGECAELIFQRAMSAGRAAATAELSAVYGKSSRLYLSGVLLLEFLLDHASDQTDVTVLNQCNCAALSLSLGFFLDSLITFYM